LKTLTVRGHRATGTLVLKKDTPPIFGTYSLNILSLFYIKNSPFNIGADAGEIAIAARLAKKGFVVTVVENNSFIGADAHSFRRMAMFVLPSFNLHISLEELIQVDRDSIKDHFFCYCA
jgi:hypothetical protein